MKDYLALLIRAEKETECQRMAENVQMRELIVDMITRLRRKVRIFVPNKGGFKTVYKDVKNLDNTINLSELRLKVSPAGLEGQEAIRFLEFAACKDDCPYMAEMVVFRGTKQEILEKLASDELPTELLRLIPRLKRDLEDDI